jgi:outer membrane protein
MRQKTIVSAIAALLVAAAGVASAQQPGPPSGKFGYVNPARVMQESKTTRKSKQALEDKFQKLAKEIDAGPKDQVERRRTALDQDMNLEREEALRQYVDRTNRVIRRIALAENLDAVFLEAAYSSKRMDITDKVIKDLDAER